MINNDYDNFSNQFSNAIQVENFYKAKEKQEQVQVKRDNVQIEMLKTISEQKKIIDDLKNELQKIKDENNVNIKKSKRLTILSISLATTISLLSLIITIMFNLV